MRPQAPIEPADEAGIRPSPEIRYAEGSPPPGPHEAGVQPDPPAPVEPQDEAGIRPSPEIIYREDS